MSKRYFLGVYWGSRVEPVEVLSDRVHAFLQATVALHPLFEMWHELGRVDPGSRGVCLESRESIAQILGLGFNRRDSDGARLSELGYSINLWNGASDDQSAAALRIDCGSSLPTANGITLDLPKAPHFLGDEEVGIELLKLSAEVWAPDWAGVISKSSLRARGFSGNKPFVDWMLYVPRALTISETHVRSISLEELGTIVVISPRPDIGDVPDGRVKLVEDALSN